MLLKEPARTSTCVARTSRLTWFTLNVVFCLLNFLRLVIIYLNLRFKCWISLNVISPVNRELICLSKISKPKTHSLYLFSIAILQFESSLNYIVINKWDITHLRECSQNWVNLINHVSFLLHLSLTNIVFIESVIYSLQDFIPSILVILEFKTYCLNSIIASFSLGLVLNCELHFCIYEFKLKQLVVKMGYCSSFETNVKI